MLIVKYNILRLLFTITVIEDLKLYQMKIISIYLTEELDEIIYMYPLESYAIKEGKYYYLKKSIYSFKQVA